MMKQGILGGLAVILFAVLVVLGPNALAMFGGQELLLNGHGPVTSGGGGGGGGTSGCNNPTPPHPAQAAGWTTLAFCADFTQNSTTNARVWGQNQTINWPTTSSWLACAGASPPILYLDTWDGANVPCSNLSVISDPVSGLQSVQNELTTAQAAGCCGATIVSARVNLTGGTWFPQTNMYYEGSVRVAPSEWPSGYTSACGSTAYCITLEPWTYYRKVTSTDGSIEIDMTEQNFSQPSTSNNLFQVIDWNPTTCNSGCYSPSGGLHPTLFSNTSFHTFGGLITSNSSTRNVSACYYFDGVASPTTCAVQGSVPSYGTSGEGNVMISLGGTNASAPTGTVHYWVQWIRVWSCAGWTSDGVGTPSSNSTSNSCSASTVYSTAP